jgi:broad specificity phosphatase PhoE
MTIGDTTPSDVLRADGRPRVYLVRHGETEWNAVDRLLSFTDMPLNARGLAQAAALGAALAADGIEFDRVLSSPRLRATQTAEIVLRALPAAPPLEVDDRLVEVDFGPLEGWTHEEVMADNAARAWRLGGTYPGVETDAQVIARARSVWADLPLQGTTLVVAHGRFMRVLLATCVLGLPLAISTRMRMRNCRPAIIEPGPEPLLLAFNAGSPFRT